MHPAHEFLYTAFGASQQYLSGQGEWKGEPFHGQGAQVPESPKYRKGPKAVKVKEGKHAAVAREVQSSCCSQLRARQELNRHIIWLPAE